MMKLLLVGLLGVTAAGGGVYLSQALNAPAGEGESADHEPQLQQISTEITAVPVVIDGRVLGYLVVRASSTIDISKVPSPDMILNPYISDSVFRAAFEFSANGMREIRVAEVKSFADTVMKLANEKFGKDAVKAVNLEQFNFVPASQIRGNRFQAG
ncbi:MAG: hypothetical protein LCH46_06725 [Proteobacteria bacterium]|nr:hypothetical protein [Pseudomonadota bacterium]